MLINNKQLLFNTHGMNIKVTTSTFSGTRCSLH